MITRRSLLGSFGAIPLASVAAISREPSSPEAMIRNCIKHPSAINPLAQALLDAWEYDLDNCKQLRGKWNPAEPHTEHWSWVGNYIACNLCDSPPSIVAKLIGRLEITLQYSDKIETLEFDEKQLRLKSFGLMSEKYRCWNVLKPSQVAYLADERGRELIEYMIKEGYLRNW